MQCFGKTGLYIRNKKITEYMKARNIILMAAIAVLSLSCSKNTTDYSKYYPNYILTCKTDDAGTFYLQLDDKTTALPLNVKKPLFGGKEVRALANITDKGKGTKENGGENFDRVVEINTIDSILTKKTVPTLGSVAEDEKKYGRDHVAIIDLWATGVEDGYLNLCFDAAWGRYGRVHYINLVTGTDPEDPYTLVLRHNANGDDYMSGSYVARSLVAFSLRELPDTQGKTVDLTLKYDTRDGQKSVKYKYCSGKSEDETQKQSVLKGVDLNLKIK